jgi:hypothetical protein
MGFCLPYSPVIGKKREDKKANKRYERQENYFSVSKWA